MVRRSTHSADPDSGKLLAEIDRLLEAIQAGASARRASWPRVGKEFEASANNLAAYLALRQQDLRPLQDSLMVLGLSSLGRIESRVLPALHAVRAGGPYLLLDRHRARVRGLWYTSVSKMHDPAFESSNSGHFRSQAAPQNIRAQRQRQAIFVLPPVAQIDHLMKAALREG